MAVVAKGPCVLHTFWVRRKVQTRTSSICFPFEQGAASQKTFDHKVCCSFHTGRTTPSHDTCAQITTFTAMLVRRGSVPQGTLLHREYGCFGRACFIEKEENTRSKRGPPGEIFGVEEWSLPDGNRPKNLRPSMRRQVLQNILHKRKRLLINILYDVLQHVFPCARRKFANMRC